MKKLGFGMMRLPVLKNGTEKTADMDQIISMVDTFMDRGFTYFDTAYFYMDSKSEDIVRQTLVERYSRESFRLADKMPIMFLADKTEEDQAKVFDNQLKKCGVDYFDYYLLHNLNESDYEIAAKLNSFDFLRKQKEDGRIRHYGFSYHGSADFLDRLLTELPDMEFVQLQINYLDWDDERVQARKCYEVAVRHGKPVRVMEPVKGGRLVDVPEKVRELMHKMHPEWSVASWAIRFAASLDNVEVVLSGMSTLEQMEDNTSYMADSVPLNQDEKDVLVKAAEILVAEPVIACTNCRYCMEKCPKQIPIPDLFALYNQDRRLRREGKTPRYELYEQTTENTGKASDCLKCGGCEKVCPQNLKIISRLIRVREIYEEKKNQERHTYFGSYLQIK